MALKLAEPPENVDKTLWLYELCRFLIQKVNSIIVALFSDNPSCSSITCPEMRASEWQYLCAVHDPPKSCCAIDYCCHTLDWAANTLTSPKHFPSRLALGTDQSTQHSQARQLTTIFRRVYRIFAHAWFQHRDMFWNVEARTGLYIFFKTVCDYYGLIPDDSYTIPAEAEGIEHSQESRSSVLPRILKREPSGPGAEDTENTSIIDGVTDSTLSTAGTTKRHRHSPSVSALAVSTVVEENEEEEDQPTELTRPITQISDTTQEDNETAQSADPERSTDEAETEDADEPPASDVPRADAAEDEPQKQSVSEEAKADPTLQSEEKQPDDDEPVSGTTVETAPTETSDPAPKSEDIEESKEDSGETKDSKAEKSPVATTEADDKPTPKADEPPAESELDAK